MAQLLVPDSGLTLLHLAHSKPNDGASKTKTGLAQVMRLELTPNLLGDVLRSARHGGKGVNVHFGKTIVSGLLNSH